MSTPTENVEHVECLQSSDPDGCAGAVEYRLPLSGTGRSFPRCDRHWEQRLDLEHGLRERYPETPPTGWSPADAGEAWSEEDY